MEVPWHLFLLTLTDFPAAARGVAKVFEERAGRMKEKGSFSAVPLYESQAPELPHASGEVCPAPTATADANTPKRINIRNTAL